MQTGTSVITSIRGSATCGFIPNKFTKPPAVFCQLVRSNQYVWNGWSLNIYPFNITKDSFQYIVKGDLKPGDQIHWLAVARP